MLSRYPRLHQRADGLEARLTHLGVRFASRVGAVQRHHDDRLRGPARGGEAVRQPVAAAQDLDLAVAQARRRLQPLGLREQLLGGHAGRVLDEEQVEVPLRRVLGREDRDPVGERLAPCGDPLEVLQLVRPQAPELSLRPRHRRRPA
jgi:hypothetical protein